MKFPQKKMSGKRWIAVKSIKPYCHVGDIGYYVSKHARANGFSVVKELKRYKDEHGYKYLTIWSLNNGYAEQLDKELLEKAGFRHISDMHPACMFLE